jgi:hypothetical protein
VCHLPVGHSVPWDSLPLHGLCPRSNFQVCITRPPPDTAGGYTLVERRCRCVQHFLFSCKASPPDCPDPTDLWLDLLDRLSYDAVVAARVRQALHVDYFDSFDSDPNVRCFCTPWLLDSFCVLSACPKRQGSNPGLPGATSRLFARAPGQIAFWVSGGSPFTSCMCIPPLGARPKLKVSMA